MLMSAVMTPPSVIRLLRSIVEVLDVKTKVKVGIFRQGKLVNQKWTNGESLCCVEYLKGEFVPGVTKL